MARGDDGTVERWIDGTLCYGESALYGGLP